MTTPSDDNGGQSGDGGDLDFEKILTGALQTYGTSSSSGSAADQPIPVDTQGAVNIWNLPKYLLGSNAPTLVFDIGHTPGGSGDQAQLGMGGPAVDVDKPHSFNINASPVEVMKQFAALSQTDPQQFQALQYQLYQGGFMGDATKVLGGWNTQTEDALSNAMVQYLKVSEGAGVPISFTQFLQNQSTANQANGNSKLPGQSSSSSSASTSTYTTDPAALTATVQKAAQSALGRNLSTEEVSKFVDSFQDQQRQAELSGKAGEDYTLPDAASDALDFVANQKPTEYAQNEVQGYADTLLGMLGVSNAPEQTPNPIAGGMK